ncbi:MAG: ArsR family transcriptional regulator [Gemmatimonadota bacterium]
MSPDSTEDTERTAPAGNAGSGSPELDRLLSALANPTRRQLIEQLGRAPNQATSLAASFDMTLPSLIQHLRWLEESGLVGSWKEGRLRNYFLRADSLRMVEAWLNGQRTAWEPRCVRTAVYFPEVKDGNTQRGPVRRRFKPEGYSSASPYLIVPGAASAIEFITNVFGGEEIRRFEDGAGGVLHAEVCIDDTIVMVADAAADWPPVGAHVHLYVPHVDAAYHAALQAGAVSLREPDQEGDRDRLGGVRDPTGTTWWIATRVAHQS